MDHIKTLQNVGQTVFGLNTLERMGDHSDHNMHNAHSAHMEHGEMDHGKMQQSASSEQHGMHQMGMMDMAMSFHGGCKETILFDFWKISDIGGLIGSMVGCFLLGILYEGLKFYRELLLRRAYQTAQYNSVPRENSEASVTTAADSGDSITVAVTDRQGPARGGLRVICFSMFSSSHLVQTLLHLLQVVLSYFLMLVAMTYNTWLFGAVAGGAMVGYFLFGWSKTVGMEVEGGCH